MKVLIDEDYEQGTIMFVVGVPIGVTARNIKAGEIIDCILDRNTKDIIVKYPGILDNIKANENAILKTRKTRSPTD